mmetsp:Transcript_29311/g.47056  ORF Transcript_29311/g.47056 Transcript_29311/m.47056 type:complete len:445 (-) Transcript_29311:112-1446(-)
MAKERFIGVLGGLRVVSSIVVLFHHIGSLDEDLWDPEVLRAKRGSNRHLAGGGTTPSDENLFYYIIGIGPGHLAVEVFLLLAGFVSAYDVWWRIGKAVTKTSPWDTDIYGPALLSRYQKNLLRRFWRLALPLIPVQFTHFMLWKYNLAYGPWLSFPSKETVVSSFEKGVPSIWSSELSGSLWILEALFIAPFVSAALQLPVLNLGPRARFIWYFMCLVYFSGNFADDSTISSNTSVVFGIILADLYHHIDVHRISFKNMLLQFLIASACLAFPWYPPPMYAARYSMIISSAACVFIALFCPFIWIRFLLDNKIMSIAARFSYELYIWHLVILSLFAVTVAPHVSKIVLYITGFTSCFVVAIVAYYLIEVPSNMFGDRIVAWFMSQQLSSHSTDNSTESTVSLSPTPDLDQGFDEADDSDNLDQVSVDGDVRDQKDIVIRVEEPL